MNTKTKLLAGDMIYLFGHTLCQSQTCIIRNINEGEIELDRDLALTNELRWEVIRGEQRLIKGAGFDSIFDKTITFSSSINLGDIRVGDIIIFPDELTTKDYVNPKSKYKITGLKAQTLTLDMKPYFSRYLEFFIFKSLVINEGSVNTTSVTENSITFPVTMDFSQIRPNVDKVYISSDIRRASGTYLITHVNNQTLRLDAPPLIDGSITDAKWQIIKGEAWLHGKAARTTSDNTIELDSNGLDLASINKGIDTIYLATDKARPSRVYRITTVKENIITLDGAPNLENKESVWQIPAGIGGMHPPLSYNFPLLGTGHDHYDGLMFVLYNGKVMGRFRFTSYTSHKWGNTESIRGNMGYPIYSYIAPKWYINYSFAVTPTKESRRYWLPPQKVSNGGGMSGIFLHWGFDRRQKGTGSEGCLVSPDFVRFRQSIIDLYLPKIDTNSVDKAVSNRSKIRLEVRSRVHDENRFRFWDGWIKGKLWLIRPDELPLAKYK